MSNDQKRRLFWGHIARNHDVWESCTDIAVGNYLGWSWWPSSKALQDARVVMQPVQQQYASNNSQGLDQQVEPITASANAANDTDNEEKGYNFYDCQQIDSIFIWNYIDTYIIQDKRILDFF